MYTYSALNQYTVRKLLTTHDYNENIYFYQNLCYALFGEILCPGVSNLRRWY